MNPPSHCHRQRFVIAGAVWLALVGLNAGNAASTSQLKAAFVLNFVRFTEWPAGAIRDNNAIVVCLTDTDVAAAFKKIVKGRTASSRNIEARWVRDDGDLRACHVAYISGANERRTADIIAMLQISSILTISDDETFAERGGMANFFVEHDNMGIAVNINAIQRAKLQVSSKLLALARIVRP
jgi:hypothetical protein